jgi:hypothetical protein
MEFSIWSWLGILRFMLVVFHLPAWSVLRRAGLNPWLFLLYAAPIVGQVRFWIFAFIRSPIDDNATEPPSP